YVTAKEASALFEMQVFRVQLILLQGLAACPSFIRWLEKFSGLPSIQSCKDNQLSSTLLQLLKGQSTEYLFQLTAVLVHHGDMHSGHFVTYRRSPPSHCSASPFSCQWLWVSDDSVRKASLQEVLSSSAYMLFYERVRNPTPSQRSDE
ncbi:hypothetical protein GOODEAATRI_024634, partial [Goodea atripinnis]